MCVYIYIYIKNIHMYIIQAVCHFLECNLYYKPRGSLKGETCECKLGISVLSHQSTITRFAPDGAQLMSMVWIKTCSHTPPNVEKNKTPHGFSFELCGLLREVGMFFGMIEVSYLKVAYCRFWEMFHFGRLGVDEPQIFSEHCPFDSREGNLLFETSS